MITKDGFTAAEQSVPKQPQAPYFREAGSGTSVVCIIQVRVLPGNGRR